MKDLRQGSSARDFVADAFAHCKFIGYAGTVLPLFEKAGIAAADLGRGIYRPRKRRTPGLSSKTSPSCGSGSASLALKCLKKGVNHERY